MKFAQIQEMRQIKSICFNNRELSNRKIFSHSQFRQGITLKSKSAKYVLI